MCRKAPSFQRADVSHWELLVEEGGGSIEERITWGYRQALSRDPRPEELALLTDLYHNQLAAYEQEEDNAAQLISTGIASVSDQHPAATLAAWTAVSRTLFNLHEMIMRY